MAIPRSRKGVSPERLAPISSMIRAMRGWVLEAGSRVSEAWDLEKGLNPKKLPSRKTAVLDKNSRLFILVSAFQQGRPPRGDLEKDFMSEYYKLRNKSRENTIYGSSF
jgi:hypothetical protein